ncbi:ABC transporter substrate-binding protein [Tepidiphilus sp. J10]|uniref:ABC transporter substrate-binding protein n=1 Tax=Tepidiphilus sp. J10 TaxID=2502185 RepID=UPI00115D6243|nr:ABC transporter substrate-binding protein [Tepidiphilus sp. J10]
MSPACDLARRRWLAALALGALAASSVASCTPEPPLRVSYHLWAGYEPLRLYVDAAPSATAGLQLVEVADAEAQLQLLRLRQVEAALITLDEVLLGRAQGLDLTVVGIIDVSAGADHVMARDRCRDAAGWRGARVAVERRGPGRLLLQAWCEHLGLDPQQLKLIPYSPPRQLDTWLQHEFDLAVTYQPYVERLRRLGAVSCFDSAVPPPIVLDVLVVRSAILGTHGKAIERLMRTHFRGLEWMHDHAIDARYRIARRFGLPLEDAFTPFIGLIFPSLEEQKDWLEHKFPEVLTTLSGLLQRAGLLPEAAAPWVPASTRFLPPSP